MPKRLILFTAEPGNFVPKNLKKEAEGLGYEAEILDVTHCIIAEGFDKELTSKIYKSAPDDKESGEVGEVTEITLDDETVVIPRLNEYHLEMKLSMLARMRDCGVKLLNSVESMALCNDKLQSQVTLSSAGIKTPYSFSMQNPDDVEKIVGFMEEQKRLKYPCVVKTLRGTHGIGVMKLDSRSSLVSVAQMLLKEEIEFMVQEFIEHDQSARIIMIGDKVLAANLRGQAKEKDEFRTNSHLGSETEPYEPSEEEVELGKKIVELFGCKFCAIDYILVGKGEKKEIIILEVNGSPGLEAISKNWPDRNLPLDVVKYAMEHSDENSEETVEPEATPEKDEEEQTPAEKKTDGIQEVEVVHIHRIMKQDTTVEARIDTGATTSSLHADEIDFDDKRVKFKRDGVTYTTSLQRVVRIKNVHNGEWTRRPVIVLDITIHGVRLNSVEFTITNRSKMKYEALIGRNILERLGLPIIISKAEDGTDKGEAPESSIEVEEE